MTNHCVVAVVALASVQVLVPSFSKTPNPWYCAAAPICAALKVASVVPARRKVSAALDATTLPVMAEPARSSSTLVPLPKVMALAVAGIEPLPETPPLIVPLLTTMRPAPTAPVAPTMATPPMPPAPCKAKLKPVPAAPPVPPLIAPMLTSVTPPVVN